MYDDTPIVKNTVKKEKVAKKIITEYNPDLCRLVIEHGEEGYFIENFAGHHFIDIDKMLEWLSSPEGEYMEFKSSFKISISACLYYWNVRLMDSLNDIEQYGSLIPVIKGILSDLNKSIPSELRDFCFGGFKVKSAEELELEKKKNKDKTLQSAFTGINIDE